MKSVPIGSSDCHKQNTAMNRIGFFSQTILYYLALIVVVKLLSLMLILHATSNGSDDPAARVPILFKKQSIPLFCTTKVLHV